MVVKTLELSMLERIRIIGALLDVARLDREAAALMGSTDGKSNLEVHAQALVALADKIEGTIP